MLIKRRDQRDQAALGGPRPKDLSRYGIPDESAKREASSGDAPSRVNTPNPLPQTSGQGLAISGVQGANTDDLMDEIDFGGGTEYDRPLPDRPLPQTFPAAKVQYPDQQTAAANQSEVKPNPSEMADLSAGFGPSQSPPEEQGSP
jgi:hypothetical protein